MARSNLIPVSRDGNRFLLAESNDKDAMAQLHDVDSDRWFNARPLQVWFKFGIYQDTTQEEYDQALAEQKDTPA